jgi:hypothetical protein
MDLAVPSFGDFVVDPLQVGDARALITRSESVALRRGVRCDAVRADVADPDGGGSPVHIRSRISRDSTLGFLAASGNPLERVLCLGRPVASSQAPRNVTPGAGDLRRPIQATQPTKEQQ